jgi:ABC-type nitrate/sulfonate/bicarbonate transport system permease component
MSADTTNGANTGMKIEDKKNKMNYWSSGKYLGLVSMLTYFVVWFAITREGFALIRPIMFPSPLMVVDAAFRMQDVIFHDVLATTIRVLIGFFAGLTIGVGLGLLMSYSKKVMYFFDPLIESIRPVPVIAMIPFFLMWFGIGEGGKLLLITLGVFAIAVVSTIEAVRNVPNIYTLAGQTLGATKLQRFRTIVIPAIVPELIGPLRVAAALSFTLVVAAEFMGAQAGVGYRILEARRLFNTDVIFLGVILIGLMSAVADMLIRAAANYLTRWAERA